MSARPVTVRTALLALCLLVVAVPARTEDESAAAPNPGASAGVSPAAPVGDWETVALSDLGLNEAVQRYSAQPTLTFWFPARADEVLTESRVRVTFSNRPEHLADVRSVEVMVNDERVALLSAAEIRDRPGQTLPVDSRLLGDTNALTFRLEMATRPCGTQVPRGKWAILRTGSIDMRGLPLPLRNDLAILPLPLVDPKHDRDATVPIVFLGPPTPERIRVAGLIAQYFGLSTSARLRFAVAVGEIPAGSAVVIVADESAARGAGLPETPPASVSLVDHPLFPGSNRKLLIFRGPSDRELETAALNFLLDGTRLKGGTAAFDRRPDALPREPYDAPRWISAAPEVKFGDIPGGDSLNHSGLGGGTLSLSFRIPPDLFVWPDGRVRFTVRYQVVAPSMEFVPDITMELNGQFAASLPRPKTIDGVAPMVAVVDVQRNVLRGFNRVQFHLSWPESEALCGAPPDVAGGVAVSIAPDSSIRFAETPHFKKMPDVAAFVEDGYPFTRMADLSDTVVALPDEPAAPDIATALSILAHFASVTGYPGYAARVVPLGEAAAPAWADKNVLVVAHGAALGSAPGLASRLPIGFLGNRLQARAPSWDARLLGAVQGRDFAEETRRASAFLSRAGYHVAVVGLAPSAGRNRSTFVVTADRPEHMPMIADLVGLTQAREPDGDALFADGAARARFWLRPARSVGSVNWYTRVRWFGANHWLLLLPSMALASLVLADVSRRSLRRRESRRRSGLA